MESITLYVFDGNSKHVSHAQRKIGLFFKEKIKFGTAFDLIKC